MGERTDDNTAVAEDSGAKGRDCDNFAAERGTPCPDPWIACPADVMRPDGRAPGADSDGGMRVGLDDAPRDKDDNDGGREGGLPVSSFGPALADAVATD